MAASNEHGRARAAFGEKPQPPGNSYQPRGWSRNLDVSVAPYGSPEDTPWGATLD
jgi:hypothetical protein